MRLILDGYNLFHRARGGFQKGDWPVVFNFFRGLRPLVDKFLPVDDVYLVLEGSPKKNMELLQEYKANRAPSDDTFIRQRDAIVDILTRMPISLVHHPDFEADDVIANLVDVPSVIVSSDSDFTQLVRQDVSVWNWRTDAFIVPPQHDYIRWKALRGDPTDNIPRCPGMTEKVALAVVNDTNRFNSLMNDAVFKGTYERNVGLITLDTFTDDQRSGLTIAKGTTDWQYVRSRFQEMGFRSMLNGSSFEKWVSTFEGIGTPASNGIP